MRDRVLCIKLALNSFIKEGYKIRCHESARIFHECLKKLGYRARVVDGWFDIEHRILHGIPANADWMIHSWVEVDNNIVETFPHEMFPEEEEPLNFFVISKDDEKAKYYKEATTPKEKRLFNKRLTLSSYGGVHKETVRMLTEKILERFARTSLIRKVPR